MHRLCKLEVNYAVYQRELQITRYNNYTHVFEVVTHAGDELPS